MNKLAFNLVLFSDTARLPAVSALGVRLLFTRRSLVVALVFSTVQRYRRRKKFFYTSALSSHRAVPVARE